MGVWRSLSLAGARFGKDRNEIRYIVICNKVSAVTSLLTLVLFTMTLVYFLWIPATIMALISAVLLALPILMNHWGYINISRLFLIFMLMVPTTIISVTDKLSHHGTMEDFEYFQYRFILMGSTLFPFILFSLKEKFKLILGISLSGFLLLLQDPIHEFFGVGYYQMGFTSPNYYFINYMVMFPYAVLVGSTYFLKSSFERSEEENQMLIKELSAQQRDLAQANQVIGRQRESLSRENIKLNLQLINKNNQLSETNEELIRHNNELQQFSYTISHNLRGPVASLTGLINLMEPTQLGSQNLELLNHLKSSISSLDTTIKDLNHIIDVRNNVSRIRQKLSITEELTRIRSLLRKEIEDHRVAIHTRFDTNDEVYAVKPMLSSILYNLISNAIKYRSPDRAPEIEVRAQHHEEGITLEVSDNGLGIDLNRFKDKLFGLYKRFHTHTDGKGLGLFLVKLQVEALGGKIAIDSAPNQGTRFTIDLPMPDNLTQQVLFENEYAELFYDASINALGVIWKKNITEEPFKEFTVKALDFMKAYRTPNWISNISEATRRDEVALNKIRHEKNQELIKSGLRRMAVVMPRDQFEPADYEQRKTIIQNAYDVEFAFFDSFQEAKEWIRSEIEKELKIIAS